MPRKIKFAIVGTGVIAPLHAQSIIENPLTELVAVCDIIEEKAAKFAADYDVEHVYKDYTKMIKRDDIDVVAVCVPSGIHGEVAIEAAKNKKHVLCEKPLEITEEKLTAMIDSCKAHGVKLGGVFQRRTLPAAILTRKAIQEGKLGKMVMGDAYLKYYRSPEYYKSAGWRGTWELDGGGALMNQGIHGIDLLQWIMGDVDSVIACTKTLARDIEVEDTAIALLKYANGALGVIQGATSVYPGQETRFELHGEKGSIIFDDGGFRTWKILDSDETAPSAEGDKSSAQDPTNLSLSGHYMLIDDMARAVLEDREPMVSGNEARRAVDLLLAIYESSKTGKEVRV